MGGITGDRSLRHKRRFGNHCCSRQNRKLVSGTTSATYPSANLEVTSAYPQQKKDTTFTKVTCNDTKYPVEHTTSEHITGEMVGATVHLMNICPRQHVLLDIPTSATRVHCNKCHAFNKFSALQTYTYGNLTIKADSDIKTVNIENHLITSIIDMPPNATLPSMNITIHNNFITDISPCDIQHSVDISTPKIVVTPSTPPQFSALSQTTDNWEDFEDFPATSGQADEIPPTPPAPPPTKN